MAIRRNKKKAEETIVDLVEARDSAQDFVDKNPLAILGGLGAIVLIIGGLFAYTNFYKKPRNNKAMEQMFQAQYQFERDSFALALGNPGGGYDGFLDLIDNYKGTKAANLSNYYVGISYLRLGRYDAAISYLTDFKASGDVMPIMKSGALGDAHSEMGEFDKAMSFYKKAATAKENEFLTPYYLQKVAQLLEKMGKGSDAVAYYQQIKDKYPSSTMGRDVDKYLTRAELHKK